MEIEKAVSQVLCANNKITHRIVSFLVAADFVQVLHLHWTAAVGAIVMLFAHWLFLAGAIASLCGSTRVDDNVHARGNAEMDIGAQNKRCRNERERLGSYRLQYGPERKQSCFMSPGGLARHQSSRHRNTIDSVVSTTGSLAVGFFNALNHLQHDEISSFCPDEASAVVFDWQDETSITDPETSGELKHEEQE